VSTVKPQAGPAARRKQVLKSGLVSPHVQAVKTAPAVTAMQLVHSSRPGPDRALCLVNRRVLRGCQPYDSVRVLLKLAFDPTVLQEVADKHESPKGVWPQCPGLEEGYSCRTRLAADPDVDRARSGEYLCELSGRGRAGTSLQTALTEPICGAVGVGAQIRT
jgi:hypothetical protein